MGAIAVALLQTFNHYLFSPYQTYLKDAAYCSYQL
jgi:hypothetical protein